MSTEFNELLPVPSAKFSGQKDQGDKTQIWIIGTREQVLHTINEFYVKRIATDRVQFTRSRSVSEGKSFQPPLLPENT